MKPCPVKKKKNEHYFTGGSNAGGGRINTPSPVAAMPEMDEKKTTNWLTA